MGWIVFIDDLSPSAVKVLAVIKPP